MEWEDKNFPISHNLLTHTEKHYTNWGSNLTLSSHQNLYVTRYMALTEC